MKAEGRCMKGKGGRRERQEGGRGGGVGGGVGKGEGWSPFSKI